MKRKGDKQIGSGKIKNERIVSGLDWDQSKCKVSTKY